MNIETWNSLLTELNQACLEIIPHVLASPPPGLGMAQIIERYPGSSIAQLAADTIQGKATWLGMPPASQERMEAAELRLGMPLPSSYKSFLQVSNGFLIPGEAISCILPVELISPFGDEHAEEARLWREGLNDQSGEFAYFVQSRLEHTIQLSGPPNGRPEFVLMDLDRDAVAKGFEILELVHEGPDYVDGFEDVMKSALRSVRYGLKLHATTS